MMKRLIVISITLLTALMLKHHSKVRDACA